ncbi:MAG: phenylacetate-CoA oxygenase subunit PaaC [Chitinophagaceae bacterium]|nr:phenylacetate-CoA oxygenase subunit PaaC [Chitinophagaceae bacterium]
MEINFQIAESSKVPPKEGFREAFILHLADNTLILSQRNSEWCGHGPVLEQDIAITNISLDLIGQARNFYQYAAQLINTNRLSGSSKLSPLEGLGEVDEDKLAYLRNEREFKNCLLVELPIGDWAQTILRQFFFSTYQFYFYTELKKSKDTQLAAIAEKSLKEVTYHLRWSSEWVIRLGDGTDESHQRMLNAINVLWPYTGELFQPALYEATALNNSIGVDLNLINPKWEEKVKEIFTEATLPLPGKTFYQAGGKEGKHTEHLGYILAEMQYMQRAYPNSEW